MKIIIACTLWDPNEASFDFSRMYDETWVEKLYRGVARNLGMPFDFVCFSDIPRDYTERAIEHAPLLRTPPDYRCCIEPYLLGAPMILMGLDTVITGHIDHLAEYALRETRLAVPRDPFFPEKVCNGVALVPAGFEWVAREFEEGGPRSEQADMDWIRELDARGEVAVIDDLFPGQVVSYKGAARDHGIDPETRIVYFHGREKPHELGHLPWIEKHWR